MEEVFSAVTASSLENKMALLKAALQLFNEHGTEAVSLESIAISAGVDSAELYSSFKNKKSIIRALFYEIPVFSVRELWQISPQNRDVRFPDFMHFYFSSFAKYRFFFREFSILIQQDPILANEWCSSYERLLSVMHEALNGWIKQGLVKPFNTAKDAEVFIELMWIVASYAPVHVRARKGNHANFDSIREVNLYVAKFLYPYHTEKGQRVLDLYME
jgi:AcrR family transcriptional regulator